MLQLSNKTPFSIRIFLLPNPDGIDTLYVIVKASFTLTPCVALAEKQAPVCLADAYHGEPDQSSLRYASELHTGKPGTDVALVGHARPEAGPIDVLAVSLAVAGRKLEARVCGDRVWQSTSTFSHPEPFEQVPLVFERAFGGAQVVRPGTILAEERNPVGRGFLGKRSASELVGQPLPNVEDPRQPLRSIGDRQTPTCFGFVAPSWLPRRRFAGTYDAAWQRRRAPYLPADFDARYFHCAAEGLVFPQGLAGGERCAVTGVSRRGPLDFTLPRCELRTEIRLAGRRETPPARLDTVLIEPDDNRLSLSYRAALPCDKQPLKVELVTVTLDKLQHVASQTGAAA